MNTTWEVICTAVQSSLFNKPVSLPDKIDWEDVFTEARKQAIASVVRDGVKNQIHPSIAAQWKIYSIQEISSGVQLLEAQKELTGLLDEHGIKHVILKGSAAAIYYPEPYFRSMGDIDFWVPEELFDDCLQLLRENDYLETKGSDERHLKLWKNNVLFEMHRYFSSEERQKPVDRYIEKAELVRGNIREIEFWMLPEIENGLVLLVHIYQHLLEGLGMRQIIDWMMYVHACLDEEGWEKFRPYAQELGLEKLARTAARLCVLYFGLEADWCGVDDEAADMLLDSIIQSGNFGHVHGSGRNVERVMVNIKRQGVFHYLQKAGEFNWRETLRVRPWLRPVAWIYQIFRYAGQVRSSRRSGETLRDDMKRSGERYELLKELGLL